MFAISNLRPCTAFARVGEVGQVLPGDGGDFIDAAKRSKIATLQLNNDSYSTNR